MAPTPVCMAILKEISRECRHKRGYSMRGLHAKDPKVRKMMEEIGCVRVMTDKGLTGRTKIQFDGRYQMKRNPTSGRKIIAFNGANDLALAPDSGAIRALDGDSFSGVAISIAAPLAISVVEVSYGEEHAN